MSDGVPSDMDNNFLSPTTTMRSVSRASTARRLSSQSATRADLFGGPTVVAPPQHLESRSNAHETAHAMELAKHHLAEGSGEITPTDSEPATPDGSGLATTDKYAFAFDIDGVLIRGGEVIPEAIDAMKVLNGQNEYGIKVQVLSFPCWRANNMLT